MLRFLCGKVRSQEGLAWLKSFLITGGRFGERFTESGPPTSSLSKKQVGLWLLVTVSISYEGVTDGPSTDRAAGDPYLAEVQYDWIGPAASAPQRVERPVDLDTWAVLKALYVREYNDVGIWGGHEGSWVESLSEDGTVTIRDAGGRFQDELPESKTTVRIVKLKMP